MRLTKIHENAAAHDDGIWTTAWLADRDGFVSGSVDESVKVWEGVEPQGGSGQPGYASRHTYTGHTLGVISVAADATGKFMASSALDSIVRVWNATTNQDCGISVSAPTEVWAIAFGPTQDDNPTLAIAAGTRAGVTFQACNPSRSADDPESMALIEKATYQLPQVITRA
jgi:WD repeat-containing protein 61